MLVVLTTSPNVTFHLNEGESLKAQADKNKNPVYLSYLLYLPSHLVEPPYSWGAEISTYHIVLKITRYLAIY